MTAWKEQAPPPKSFIQRDDGRICLYSRRIIEPTKHADKRMIEKLHMACGDTINFRLIGGVVFYPAATPGPVTCIECIAKKDNPRLDATTKTSKRWR